MFPYQLEETNILKNEKIIESFYNDIKRLWLQKNFIIQSDLYKSPIQYSTENKLKFNEYEYERIINKNSLEKYYYERIKGYKKITFFYSSGMSAISNTMYIIKNLFSQSIKGITDIGYFETENFFEATKRLNILTVEKDSINELIDFYFFEPIQYNFKQICTDYVDRIEKIKNSETFLFIIIDITLCGDMFPFNKLIDRYKNAPNLVFILVESLLKLKQQGLELTNAGRATWHISTENFKECKAIWKLAKIISDTNGTHLSDFNSRVLNNENFLNSNDYTYTILSNNMEFYNEIKHINNQIIEEIVYRVSNIDPDVTMPFIFIKLKNSTEEFCRIFLSYIYDGFKKISLTVDVRDSFGFRNLSVQYFVDRSSGESIFKIAIGHLKGIKYWILLDLIKKTDTYINIENFKKQFEVHK